MTFFLQRTAVLNSEPLTNKLAIAKLVRLFLLVTFAASTFSPAFSQSAVAQKCRIALISPTFYSKFLASRDTFYNGYVGRSDCEDIDVNNARVAEIKLDQMLRSKVAESESVELVPLISVRKAMRDLAITPPREDKELSIADAKRLKDLLAVDAVAWGTWSGYVTTSNKVDWRGEMHSWYKTTVSCSIQLWAPALGDKPISLKAETEHSEGPNAFPSLPKIIGDICLQLDDKVLDLY